jgi:hypothetical protein
MKCRPIWGLLGLLVSIPAAARAQAPARPFVPPSEYRVVPAPSFNRVFLAIPSDEQLRKEMAKERPEGPPPPAEPLVEQAATPVRLWPPLSETIEAPYTCYGRLYFEQINSERYGWDLGLVHPLLSAGIFYADVIALPYRIGLEPLCHRECSAGYCLPGDPVPLLLYPPELSATGALSEAATIGLLAVIFP